MLQYLFNNFFLLFHKYLFIFLFCFSISFSYSSHADPNLIKLDTLEDGTDILVSTSTIDNDGKYTTVWAQLNYPELRDGFNIIRFKTEIDCSKKADRIIYLESFGTDTMRVEAGFLNEPNHTPTRDGTFGRYLVDFVCD